MRKEKILLLAMLQFLLLGCKNREIENILQYVDPFIGTEYTGHTFPGAVYPFGMMQPGPQTGNFEWKYCAGYRNEDKFIYGFSQNRLNGTGIPDLGDLLLMPFSGTPNPDFKSSFSKELEKASPGYYFVDLIDNSVKVELTTMPHVAMHRYEFTGETPGLYIDFQNGLVGNNQDYYNRVLSSNINFEDNRTITGHYNVKAWVERQLFYVICFDKPFTKMIELKKGKNTKAPQNIFYFNLGNEKKLQVKIAFSTVSIENAKQNMDTEIYHWDFDKVRDCVENEWHQYLSRVQVSGTTEQKRNFYTSLYRLFIQPNNIADIDGRYRGANDSIQFAHSGKYFSTFSLWDTFRAAHPLYTILTPELVPDFVNSMLSHADVQGYLPIWSLWGKENFCMIGNHGVSPVVEACLKNFPTINQEEVYRAVKKSLTVSHYKGEWDIYDKYGYFPYDLIKEESVSRTLESGYDDYCAALLAKKLHKDDDYIFFMNRSRYYRNLFDSKSGFMRGKDSNGSWRTPFDVYHISHAGTAGGDYTEGNAWQYLWHVLHDVNGLVDLMGGKVKFAEKLDSLFINDMKKQNGGFTGDVTGLIGLYAHGNEPSHHTAYLYSMIGQNWKTAELIRDIFDRFYRPVPNGLCGNDDCGQMSAWYIFGAMGFYPVNPVSGEYIIGAPQFPKIEIELAEGRKFTIIAKQLTRENKYVKAIKLNGQKLDRFVITHEQIVQGGVLEFIMSNEKVNNNI